jgi:hypothetical protein
MVQRMAELAITSRAQYNTDHFARTAGCAVC